MFNLCSKKSESHPSFWVFIEGDLGPVTTVIPTPVQYGSRAGVQALEITHK